MHFAHVCQRLDALSVCATANSPRNALVALRVHCDGSAAAAVVLHNALTPLRTLRAALAPLCGGSAVDQDVMRRARVFAAGHAQPVLFDDPANRDRSTLSHLAIASGCLYGPETQTGRSPEGRLRWYRDAATPPPPQPLCWRDVLADWAAWNSLAPGVRARALLAARLYGVVNDGVAALVRERDNDYGTHGSGCDCFMEFAVSRRAEGGVLTLRALLSPAPEYARAAMARAAAGAAVPREYSEFVASLGAVRQQLYTFFRPSDDDSSSHDGGGGSGDASSSSSSSASTNDMYSRADTRVQRASHASETCVDAAVARYAPHRELMRAMLHEARLDEFHAGALAAALARRPESRLCERMVRHSRALLHAVQDDTALFALARACDSVAGFVSLAMAPLVHTSAASYAAFTASGYHVAALVLLYEAVHSVMRANLTAAANDALQPRACNTWGEYARVSLCSHRGRHCECGGSIVV